MKTLISMVDFILENAKQPYVEGTKYKDLVNYANFLKQPLNLGMFFPCDEDGDVLEKPEDYEKRLPNMMTEYNDEVYRYQQAKEKVLFEGFEFKEYERMICFEKKGIEIFIYNKNYQTFSAPRGRIITIEDLIMYEFELTESTVK